MEGLDLLNRLPHNVQAQLNSKYGSLEKFYQIVFDLHNQDYNSKGNNKIVTQAIYDIQDELEEYGVIDGATITTEISSDFGEIIVSKHISKMNDYLKTRGTDYPTMSKWMKDTYGI